MACSDRVNLAINGHIPVYPLSGLVFGIMFPKDVPPVTFPEGSTVVKPVITQEDFKLWCEINNEIGFGSFNSEAHYHLVKQGKLNCFVAFVDGIHVGISAIINDNGVTALDFVDVLAEYRGRGVGTALYEASIAFANNLGFKYLLGWAFPDTSPSSYSLFKKFGFPLVTSS